MRVLFLVALLLSATAANAQTYVTTTSADKNTVTTTGPGGTRTMQIARSGNTVTRTITFERSGYRPMGSGGYHPVGDYHPMGR
jgi:hypothetical protein